MTGPEDAARVIELFKIQYDRYRERQVRGADLK
jgi:hypothetical protein